MAGSETGGSGTRSPRRFWTELVEVLHQLLYFGKTLGQIALGVGIFLLAAYVYLNPLLDDGGWLFGIGFYELLLLAFGSALFLMAYRNIRAIEAISR